VPELARSERLLSEEHFSVDGTLIKPGPARRASCASGRRPRRQTIGYLGARADREFVTRPW
jgi:hypothetical protein